MLCFSYMFFELSIIIFKMQYTDNTYTSVHLHHTCMVHAHGYALYEHLLLIDSIPDKVLVVLMFCVSIWYSGLTNQDTLGTCPHFRGQNVHEAFLATKVAFPINCLIMYACTSKLSQRKSKQLHLKTNYMCLFKYELPQAGPEHMTYCILVRCSAN